MLSRYAEADLEPKDHVLFFRTYVAVSDATSAQALIRKLGSSANSLMLNHALLACSNVRQPEEGWRLLNEAHDLEEELAQGNRIVDVVSYNIVIKGFGQAGQTEHCLECLQAMERRGLRPDDITFSTLLDVCMAESDTAIAKNIVSLVLRGDHAMDTVLMCTQFIRGLVKADALPKALELYEEMKRRHDNIRPDVVTYSVLIRALVDRHNLEKALEMLQDMRATGLEADDIILMHLLEGCRYKGDLELGKKLFAEIIEAGVKPSEWTLVTMLKLQGRCGAHQEAYDLVAGWQNRRGHGAKPSVIHYTCLMSGCLRTKSYDQAWAAFELMLAGGVAPDETLLSTLLPGMVAAQSWERVLLLANRALTSTPPMKVPVETLNNALSQMLSSSGFGRQAETLQRLMQAAGIHVNPRRSRRTSS
jgi:pentatricopeptide repeat protein